jgi:RimJ/RimL family protein N-acetyltransferase
MTKDEVSFLNGDLVSLRGVRREDMVAYGNWLDDDRVTKYLEMGWRPTTEGDLEEAYKLLSETPIVVGFAIVENKTRKAVGVCGLYSIEWISRRAQFNILIGEPSAWDKGFGTEALHLLVRYGFDRLNLESLQLGVNAENPRAIRSYEKAGFVHEGRRRKFVYRDGRYYDSILMSMLREEYEAKSDKDA